MSSMKPCSPSWSQWHGHVKQFFTMLQGHQKRVLALLVRVARGLGQADSPLVADRGWSCLRLMQLCQAHGWHDVVRIKQDEYAQRKLYGTFGGWQSCAEIVAHTGQSWLGTVRLWKEH